MLAASSEAPFLRLLYFLASQHLPPFDGVLLGGVRLGAGSSVGIAGKSRPPAASLSAGPVFRSQTALAAGSAGGEDTAGGSHSPLGSLACPWV